MISLIKRVGREQPMEADQDASAGAVPWMRVPEKELKGVINPGALCNVLLRLERKRKGNKGKAAVIARG